MRKIPFIIFLTLSLLAVSTLTASGAMSVILPFRNGSTAMYGPLGVHDCGFSTNFKAVDLIPEHNEVYAVESGTISYVCRDSMQIGIRVGNIIYDHLNDDFGFQIGDSVTKGQFIGSMVTGPFTAPCGYADQLPGHFHLHFCFEPDEYGLFYADGYILNTYTGSWTKNDVNIAPTGSLTAAWGEGGEVINPPISGGGKMFNIFDWILQGLVNIFMWFLNTFFLPPGSAQSGIFNLLNFTKYFSSGVITVIELTGAALSTFNWVIPGYCFAIDMILFFIQMAITIYSFITDLVKKLPFL